MFSKPVQILLIAAASTNKYGIFSEQNGTLDNLFLYSVCLCVFML
jgi:hypothetical protein